MKRRITATQKLLLMAGVVSLTLVAPLAAQEELPEAAALVQKMSSYLGSLNSFQFKAVLAFDDVPVPDAKIQYHGAMEVFLRRPNALQVDYEDDVIGRQLWIDGQTATIVLNEDEHWARTSAASSLDVTLARMAADYGTSIPLDDFFLTDPGSVLMAGAVRGRTVGSSDVGGVPCHHLVVGQEDINWQLWIAQGDKPLPRKMVITYKNLPMAPDFSAVFTDWELDPKISEDHFEAQIPAGSTQIDFLAIEEAQP